MIMFHQSRAEAMVVMPKGHKECADATNTKAAKAAGRASIRMPAKAALGLPDHKLEEAL